MDKKSAAEKVAKLRKLANHPRTPSSERDTARKSADKLSTDHGLGPADLAAGRLSAAYDELLSEVEKFGKNNPKLPTGIFGAEQAVTDVVGRLRQVSDADKSSRLRTFVTVVRTAHLFVGDNRYVSEIKTIMDTALKNHDVSI